MGGAADFRELTPDQAAFAEELALEWLGRHAEHSPELSPDAAQARFALDLARDPEQVEAQGTRNIERQILKTQDAKTLAHNSRPDRRALDDGGTRNG